MKRCIFLSLVLRRLWLVHVCLATGLVAFCPTVVSAEEPLLLDVVHLRSGGEIQGTVKEVIENKRKFYIVETVDGGLLKIAASQVRRVESPSAEYREYLGRAASLPDTVDAHWEMQQWCLKNRLKKQREYHLMKVIQFDPDHKDARLILGYRDFGGAWVHNEQFMQNNGYVKNRSIYQLPIAIEMLKRREQAEQLEAQWRKDLKRWHRLVVKRNDFDAKNRIENATHPAALSTLIELYNNESIGELRRLYLDTIGKIKSSSAQNALVLLAMKSNDRDVVDTCINLLKQPHFHRAGIVSSIRPFLSPKPDNSVQSVNDAAFIAGEMGDEIAIRPLIDALVTSHKVRIRRNGGNANVGQNSNGSGLTWGNQPTHALRAFENQGVLDALKRLTNGTVDFGFDEQSWLNWYIANRTIQTGSLNRDN